MSSLDDYITLTDAAEDTGISTQTLSSYAKRGLIETAQVGQTRLVLRDSVEDVKAAQMVSSNTRQTTFALDLMMRVDGIFEVVHDHAFNKQQSK